MLLINIPITQFRFYFIILYAENQINFGWVAFCFDYISIFSLLHWDMMIKSLDLTSTLTVNIYSYLVIQPSTNWSHLKHFYQIIFVLKKLLFILFWCWIWWHVLYFYIAYVCLWYNLEYSLVAWNAKRYADNYPNGSVIDDETNMHYHLISSKFMKPFIFQISLIKPFSP